MGLEVKQASVDGAQCYGDARFPAMLACSGGTPDETRDWLRANLPEILGTLSETGAILFRGFPVASPEDFDAFVRAFELPPFTYDESLSNAVRRNLTRRVFTANEAPAEVSIDLHHEMAQTPTFPQKLFFFCEKAAEEGGETPLCRSDILLARIKTELPAFYERCVTQGVRYRTEMPSEEQAASGQGRSWRSTLGVFDATAAVAKLAGMHYRWRWCDDGALEVISRPLPAVRALEGGGEAFFNQLIAAYKGWKNGAEAITFGDGSAIDGEDMDAVCALADELTFLIPWQAGDVALVDNFRVMHGRRPFKGTRRVLASLAEKAEAPTL